MPNIALEQEAIAAAITIALILYLHACDVHQHYTARSTKAEQRLCSEALTSEVGRLQNFHACKKWIPLSSNF